MSRQLITFGVAAWSLVALLLIATGCGGGEHNYRTGSDVGHYHEVVIPWKGTDLYCVRLDTGNGNSSESGLSCDWEAWHAERGDR